MKPLITLELLACALSTLFVVSDAAGDRGSIPYFTDAQMSRRVRYEVSPDKRDGERHTASEVVVYEPDQLAIILWNRREEILLLSTTIRSSAHVSILEVIPFPSEPRVETGDFDTFEKMEQLYREKLSPRTRGGRPGGLGGFGNVGWQHAPQHVRQAAQITFHEKMGAHDVSVVEVLDVDFFIEWVMLFLRDQKAVRPAIHPGFVRVIQNYLRRDHRWFVFDAIEASNQLRSREPIQYRFACDHLYYPLEISSLETGPTTIDMLLVLRGTLKGLDKLPFDVHSYESVRVTSDEVGEISAPWATFMGKRPFRLQKVKIRGDLQRLRSDFIARDYAIEAAN